jgi:ribonuclease D
LLPGSTFANYIKQETIAVYWVDDSSELDALARDWLNLSTIAVDTEFERRTTFYAKLALLQVFDGNAIYLIDPLALDCPESLKAVFGNPSIVKVLHSCKEDIEVLYTTWGVRVVNLFDTQVAHHLAENDPSIGYARLVEHYAELTLAKQQTQSDWLKRPLSDAQLKYAAEDVLYLLYSQQLVQNKLTSSQQLKLLQTECQEIVEQAIKRVTQPSDYREAKDVSSLNGKDLSLFKILFEWREQTAKKDNRTKNHIIKDHQLVQMASCKPEDHQQLKAIEQLHGRSLRLYGKHWLSIIQNWKQAEPAPLSPVINPRDISQIKPLVSVIESLVKQVAEQSNIPASLVMSKRIMRKLAYALITDTSAPGAWSGWRKKLLNDLLIEKTQQFVKN